MAPAGLLETNLVFYMMVFLVFMAQVNLMKNTFNLGYFKFTDETKIEFLFAIKAFVAVFVTLKYMGGSRTFFDFDLEKAHDASLERVNTLLALYGSRLALPVDFTYSLLASVCSMMTFCLVKLNIRFSYYFFVISKNSTQLLNSAGPQTADKKRYRNLLFLMYFNLLAPLLVCLMYIEPLFEVLVVPDYLS